MKWGDRGSWGYLAFPAPTRPACLLVPNELLDYFNERTESIIIIISKGGRGSKQLHTLAGLALVAPFDQQRQRGFFGRTHKSLLVNTTHPLHSLDVNAHTRTLPEWQNRMR